MKALVLTLLFLLLPASEAKVFNRWELASVLKQLGLAGYRGYDLDNWLCMSYHESGYSTQVVGPPNLDGSRNYGIFQINSRWWCNNYQGITANGCNTPCSGLPGETTAKGEICQNGLGTAVSEVHDPAFLFIFL
ncbi:lysozyme C-1-like [Python bivittatus]|uniref:Lysozyme C-1-like n=1 Tax=Python bivittatus TaxID=176946 RepID=A0A9F5JDD1_PYTBI|nr:lysozyme C-1-like [Python bivittatus]